ncbi:unnamed protein product [Amoebophrya sp. A25]|nr:unnamed protein product [Amoebophrya sp. A25]|eukprot:GSA25T00004031001.1
MTLVNNMSNTKTNVASSTEEANQDGQPQPVLPKEHQQDREQMVVGDSHSSTFVGPFARLKGSIQRSLESQGLTPDDVAKIGGLFLAAKYATYGGFVLLGVRYRPMLTWIQRQRQAEWAQRSDFLRNRTRWLRKQQNMFQSSQAIADATEQLRRARTRIRQRRDHIRGEISRRAELERTSKAGSSTSSSSKNLSSGGSSSSKTSSTSANGPNGSSSSSSSGSNNPSTSSSSNTRTYWQRKLTTRLQSGMNDLPKGNPYSRLAWAMDRYSELAERLSKQAESSRIVQMVAKWVNNNPRTLALGVAEGTLLYKFTFPITAPIEFFLICKAYLAFGKKNNQNQRPIIEDG